jgi:hypothetical protein
VTKLKKVNLKIRCEHNLRFLAFIEFLSYVKNCGKLREILKISRNRNPQLKKKPAISANATATRNCGTALFSTF